MPIIIQTKQCEGPCDLRRPVTEFWRDSAQEDGYMRKCAACTQQRREEIAEARANGEVPEDARRSLEERKRRSELATQLHAEGRFGGSEFGTKGGVASGQARRVPKIANGVLEYFRQDEKFALVVRAFESNLRSNSKGHRLAAAKEIVSMEQKDDDAQLKRLGMGQRPEDMSQEALNELLAPFLMEMLKNGMPVADLTLPESSVREVA